MTRQPRPSEQRRDLETAIRQLTRFADNHAVIVAHLRDWSAGVGGSGGPRPKNAVSDPTGQSALATDQWGQMRSKVADAVNQVYRLSCELEHVRQQVAAPALPKEPEERGLAKCVNPDCPDDAWAYKAGRCRPCFDYKRAHDRERRVSKDPGE